MRQALGERGITRASIASALRVLVIDDDADAGEALGGYLSLHGCLVEIARDGVEGIAKAHACPPQIVICDVGMPVMDGYEVARKLKQDPALAATLLAAHSGFDSAEDRRRAMEAGFDVHLRKPLAESALSALLTRAASPGS